MLRVEGRTTPKLGRFLPTPPRGPRERTARRETKGVQRKGCVPFPPRPGAAAAAAAARLTGRDGPSAG